eukprot:3603172-Pyramimonas_sp.AAC.1
MTQLCVGGAQSDRAKNRSRSSGRATLITLTTAMPFQNKRSFSQTSDCATQLKMLTTTPLCIVRVTENGT